jgi:flavin-dependent dehydrogenase
MGYDARTSTQKSSSARSMHYDIAIVGGGPGGSTAGGLLKKYAPELSVGILERAVFPREHVGESQLPPISVVLDELGCWDDVERANFPIKVGATFRWGRTPELWDFEFLPLSEFKNEPRPARFVGQRQQTAFQVDRAVYDHILLNHATKLGCEVRQGESVVNVHVEDDRVRELELKGGERVTARWYIDASGHVGVVRRALGVETRVPTSLVNIAIWDYWENAPWAVEIGVGGTRIQVMSQKQGWVWFIPLGPTRTSIGYVCPQEVFKELDRDPTELLHETLHGDPYIAKLLEGATCRNRTQITRDWSFVSSRAFGDNWFLVGEALGFADPILSAGLTLTHTGARELAYTLMAIDRGEHDRRWLCEHYQDIQRRRVEQHIRFADFWYAANGQFTDLQQHCQKIAKDAGLELTGNQAWRWLAWGGFANDFAGQTGIGGYDLAGMKQIAQRFLATPAQWKLNDVNVLKLNLLGAKESTFPVYENGKITSATLYTRGQRELKLTGLHEAVFQALRKASDIGTVHAILKESLQKKVAPGHVSVGLNHCMQALEVMVSDGWVDAKYDPRKPKLKMTTPEEGGIVHKNRDTGPTRPAAQ